MSYLDTKQALMTQLAGATIPNVTNADIAIENEPFDPTGKALWLSAHFIPATTESTGKTLASGDEQRGIFQISVFVKLFGGSYDNVQLSTIDSILSAFQYSTSVVYNGQTVDILEATVNNGSENESWFKRDISINYLTFSER